MHGGVTGESDKGIVGSTVWLEQGMHVNKDKSMAWLRRIFNASD